MYSNCSPNVIGPGCLIYADSEGGELWPRDGWYFDRLTVTSYFISRGEIIDKLPCFK
jgi:hypothetical protein